MREALADYSHSAWAGWMKYQFSKAELQPDGTWIMPAWAVERWQRQMNTPYAELPEEEKASDRKGADEILAIVGKEAAYERGKAEERARYDALKAVVDKMAVAIRSIGMDAVVENGYEGDGYDYEFPVHIVDSDYVNTLYQTLREYEQVTDPAPKPNIVNQE